MQQMGSRLPAVVCLATALLCLTAHETGHALAGYLTGCKVSEFVVISLVPHVRLEGQCSNARQALQAISGSAFLIVCWCVFLIASRRMKNRIAIETASFFAAIEALGWMLSSLFYGQYDRHDDAATFISASGLPPHLVVFGSLTVCFAGILLFVAIRPLTPAKNDLPIGEMS